MQMRRALGWCWLFLLLASLGAAAQEFPTRTVRIVVPFTAGGGNDVVARAMADRLSRKWSQPVVVENRPGAGTALGTRAVVEAAPDGHTLLFTSSSSLVVTPHTMKLPYDPLRDLEPILPVVSNLPALAVGNHVPANTVAEFIAYAKANPGKLTYASPGAGAYSHVAMEHLRHLAGIDMVHVPYGGSSPVLTDMLGGRIDAYLVAFSVFQELEKQGRLKVLAMATEARHALRPELPTIAESIPGFAVDVWFFLAAPARTPPVLLDRLHADVSELLRDAAFIESFVRPQGFAAMHLGRAAFAERIKADYVQWGKMVEIAGMKKP
jgi:tripartite-type tricarboxylate transporter receptor subunit TctC